jgi:hypothetical protein
VVVDVVEVDHRKRTENKLQRRKKTSLWEEWLWPLSEWD